MVTFFRRHCWRTFTRWVTVGVVFALVPYAVRPNWDTNKTDQTEMEFLKRQERYMDACAAANTGQIREVFLHEPSGLAVCHTPKVGCTFWKRIITYLQTEEKPWKSPFEIDRFSVHHSPSVKITFPYNSNSYVKDRIGNFTRVVFSRDPYSRLWSTYVDKFLLPDYWMFIGQRIYKYRKLGDDRCPLHITFEDFLHYALYNSSDSHWEPLYTVCNPCGFYPKYVGKMETFSRDVNYILNKSGLGYLLTNQNHDRHVEDEMTTIIDYNFKFRNSHLYIQSCLTVTDLAERLWRTFQLNGYISLRENFPQISVNKSATSANFLKAKDAVTKIFIDYYRQNRRSRKDWKQQRHLVLVNAYKEIPLKLRKVISKRYKRDFELFDYEQYPKDIFPEKYS